MITWKNAVLATGAALAMLASPALAAPSISTVAGNQATPTFIADLQAGQTYEISVTGVVDLLVGFNGGSGLTTTADGVPTYNIPAPYANFNPGGTPEAQGARGPAYNFNLGALVGSFTPTPQSGISSMDFFLLGLGTTLTPSADVTLYGLVNDAQGGYHDNSFQAFSVSFDQVNSPGAVPEPATWLMLLTGFGLVGTMARRRERVVAA